jgi:hypothetical protein
MRQLIIFISLALNLSAVKSQGITDKYLHFGAGYVLGAGATAWAMHFNAKYPYEIGLAVPTFVGLGKEYYDFNHGGTPEIADGVFTFYGGLFGAMTLKISTTRNKSKKKPIKFYDE